MKEYRVEMYDGFDWIQAHNTYGATIESSNSKEWVQFQLKKLIADWRNPLLLKEEIMPTLVPSGFRIVEREVGKWKLS